MKYILSLLVVIILMTSTAKLCLHYHAIHIAHIIEGILGSILLIMIFNPVLFLIVALLMILCGKYDKLKKFIKNFQNDNNFLNEQNHSRMKLKKLNNRLSYTNIYLNPKNNSRRNKYSSSSAIQSPLVHNYSAKNNPASGLPMAGLSSIDVRGNTYGTRRL